MTAPVTTIDHWEQPGFQAMPETDGHGDTCGPDAMLAYLHLAQNLPMTIAQVDAMRQAFINAGLMDTPSYKGMVITSIAQAFEQFYHVTPVKVVPWGQVNLDTFHQDMRAIFDTHHAVIWETADASALPGNQANPHVADHFVTAWGLDSVKGYLTANGDLQSALGTQQPVSPVWYSWSAMLPATPSAYLILPALTPPGPPPQPPVEPPEDENVPDIQTRLADIESQLSTISQLIAIIGTDVADIRKDIAEPPTGS